MKTNPKTNKPARRERVVNTRPKAGATREQATRAILPLRVAWKPWLPIIGLSTFSAIPLFGQQSKEQEMAPPGIPRPMRHHKQADNTRVPTGEFDATRMAVEAAPIDGYGNNRANPLRGAAEQPFIRLGEAGYGDESGSPAGSDRPNARAISNAICAQDKARPNRAGATDFLWQWGQFLDHDIVETPSIDPAEPFNITVPLDDESFPGGSEIPLNRSFYEENSSPREQVNAITAYIDASNVYGSDEERAYALRTLDGSGRLKVTSSANGDLLPYNHTGLSNAPATSPNFFLAGDVRANEQAGLTAMHTLFVREHNHWAERFLIENPDRTGEDAYQFARMMVAAEIQAITYNEFLPLLLGRDALPPYRGYNPKVDATIANEFATAAYRIGHSMLSPTLLRLDASGQEAAEGHLSLAQAFFNPSLIEDNGIDSILRGLAGQACQELDEQVVDEVRNFLFGAPGAGGFDLAALNIQRGRDHGLPGYNDMREGAGFPRARNFRDIDRELGPALGDVYESPDDVDLWIGCLCEPKVPGSMVGPLLQRVLVNQFSRLRDGDRFYYRARLDAKMAAMVDQQTLAVIIRRNTDIGKELPDDVFRVSGKNRPQETSGKRPARSTRQRP